MSPIHPTGVPARLPSRLAITLWDFRAAAGAFLASAQTSFITDTELVANGGRTTKRQV
jgi:hypothetical protein